MLGREMTAAAIGSGAVDADFWALVCEDEEWLEAEFYAIVSEPGEMRVRSSSRACVVGAARPRVFLTSATGCGGTPRIPSGGHFGPRWRCERSPPRRCTHSDNNGRIEWMVMSIRTYH